MAPVLFVVCQSVTAPRSTMRVPLQFAAVLRAVLLSTVAAILVGCANLPPPTPELARFDPQQGYRFTHTARGADNTSSLLVVLTLSGGGTRAAALAHGILEELAAIDIEWEGRWRRLIDEVDSISAVSGGSVTATYYALYGDRLFSDFTGRFLHRDIEADFTRKLINPAHWPRLWSPYSGRSDLLADIFDEVLFDGATFADLSQGPGRPYLTLSATDMAAGTRFEFVQEQFDLICADLGRYSVARAVAASAAVPVLMSPIMLSNRAGRCGYPSTGTITQGLQARRLSSRQLHYASKLRSYLDAEARPYIYLLDGGLADNLGLRSPLETVFMHDDAWHLVQRLGIADVRKVVFIVVNASTGPDPRWSLASSIPGIGQVLQAFKDIPIDRYSFETKELLAASFERWASDIKFQRKAAGDTAGDDLEFVMIDADFEALHDRAEREALMRIPTSWSLDAATVARIRMAAKTLLAESASFQQLLRDLRARPRASEVAP
jgi:NTE family protein